MLYNFNNKIYSSGDIFDKKEHLKTRFYQKEVLPVLYDNPDSRKAAFSVFLKFKKEYPSFRKWQQQDILLRLGKDNVLLETPEGLNYRARPYIQTRLFFDKYDPAYLFSLTSFKALYNLIDKNIIDFGMDDLVEELTKLGYKEHSVGSVFKWGFFRIMLLLGKKHYSELTLEDISDFIRQGLNEKREEHKKDITCSMFMLQQALYSMGIVNKPPVSGMGTKEYQLTKDMNSVRNQDFSEVLTSYKQSFSARPESSMNKNLPPVVRFFQHMETRHSETKTLNEIRIKHILSFVDKAVKSDGSTISTNTKRDWLIALHTFFNKMIKAGYLEKNPIDPEDIPTPTKSVHRNIPDDEFAMMLDEFDNIADIWQRTAIKLQAFSAARQDEIRRLRTDALKIADGRYFLVLPVSKANEERMVPIDPEAADAFQEMLEYRKKHGHNTRKIPDKRIRGKKVDFLFAQKNRLRSVSYLFRKPLKQVCLKLGLVDIEGKPKYASHSFRHTLATLMANHPGSSFKEIVDILGHKSHKRTQVYTNYSNETHTRTYNKVMGPIKEKRGRKYMDILNNN